VGRGVVVGRGGGRGAGGWIGGDKTEVGPDVGGCSHSYGLRRGEIWNMQRKLHGTPLPEPPSCSTPLTTCGCLSEWVFWGGDHWYEL